MVHMLKIMCIHYTCGICLRYVHIIIYFHDVSVVHRCIGFISMCEQNAYHVRTRELARN